MSACTCGAEIDDGSLQCPRCEALHLLGVAHSATEAEIKEAYRLLVKVWHPDRFQTDLKLKQAAEIKLQAINSAFVFLSSPAAKKAKRQTAKAAPKPASPEPQTTTRPAPPDTPPFVAPVASARRASPPLIRSSLRLVRNGIILVVLLLFVRYAWIALDVQQDSSTEDATQLYHFGKDHLLKGLEAPKQRFLDAVEHDLRRLGLESFANLSQSAAAPVTPPAISVAPDAGNSQPRRLQADAQQTPTIAHSLAPYITLGATRKEIEAALGAPTNSTENKLVYGSSEIYLKDDSVTSWRIDSAHSPIRVKLWPASAVDPSLDHFSIGSSKDVVLVVQGTPTAFTDEIYRYGNSAVYFQNNRVVRWVSDPASVHLRAQ